METLERVFQPPIEEVFRKDFHLKGEWARKVFENDYPLVLELGCGKGEYTVGLARLDPLRNYLGLDIKGARIWTGARTTLDEGLINVAFLRTRIDFIESFFGSDEVESIWITFPDPQEKNRRQKKRLTSASFLNRYRKFLIDGGAINLKTDNHPLFRYTLALARHNNLQIDRISENLYGEGWNDETVSIQTYYESKFLEKGARINFIRFRLQSDREIKELHDDIR